MFFNLKNNSSKNASKTIAYNFQNNNITFSKITQRNIISLHPF